MKYILLCAALLVGLSYGLVEYGEAECEFQNDCHGLKNLKHCQNTTLDGEEDQGLHCVECLDDIDCPAGEFCWLNTLTPEARGELKGYSDKAKAWQCVKFGDPIGNRCDHLINTGDDTVDRNSTEHLFCGAVAEWDIPSGKPAANGLLWEGACHAGRCYECSRFSSPPDGSTRNAACYPGFFSNNYGASQSSYSPVYSFNMSFSGRVYSVTTVALLVIATLGCVFNPPLSLSGGMPQFNVPPPPGGADPDPVAIPPPPEKVGSETKSGGWFGGWFGGRGAAANVEAGEPEEEPAPPSFDEQSVSSRSTRSKKSKKGIFGGSRGSRNTQATNATRNDFDDDE